MLKKILKKIKPTEEEKRAIEETCKELIQLVKKEFKDFEERVEVNVFGSVSRDTWLSHEKDIDLFVSFPTLYTKDQLEDAATRVGRRILSNLEKRFAEHPYVMGEYDGYSVEIVPCYLVEDATKRLSAVDRSPFHDAFVRGALKGRQDEVRLLKQFLKGIGCYGAEARIEGFSGYLCELLIIHFGSFEKVLTAAAGWRIPVAIEMKGRGKVSGLLPSPMIFLDPTDRERNVASALSIQNLSLFIYAAKRFLESPRESFFFPKKRAAAKKELRDMFRQRGTHLISLAFQAPSVIDDILHPQLRKAARLFERLLEDSGFHVINSRFSVGAEAAMVFELDSTRLPFTRLHTGPPVNSKNEREFLEKHKGSKKALTAPFIMGDRWAVFIKRDYTDAASFLTAFLSAKDLRKKGVPSHVAREVQKGFEIRTGEDAIKGDMELFTDLFDPVFPWEVEDG